MFQCLIAACLAILARQDASSPIDVQRASQLFREARALSTHDGGRLWGRELYGPLMFVDPSTLWAVTNQSDKQGALKAQDRVFVGQLPRDFIPANFARDWNGVHWTVIMWSLSGLPHVRGRLMMHECFHRIQDSLGLPSPMVSNDHLDTENGRTWMRLEMRALSEALQLSGSARLRAERDALLFRGRRRALCGKEATENERRLEMNEGLAEFTGLELSGWSPASLPVRAAARLDSEQASPTFARSFAYATGPAYGILLDSARPAWRRALSASSDLSLMLERALQLSLPDDPGEAMARLEPYDGMFLVAEERRMAAARERRIAEMRWLFVEGPVLSLPVSDRLNFSFDPNGVISLPGVGQVNDSGKVSDDWGVLEVASGGYLLLRSDQQVTRVSVPAPKSASADPIQGPGWTLRLNPGWRLVAGQRAGDWTVLHGP